MEDAPYLQRQYIAMRRIFCLCKTVNRSALGNSADQKKADPTSALILHEDQQLQDVDQKKAK